MDGVSGVRKGGWTDEEDVLLKQCIETHGEGQWHKIPSRAGLNRCRKSCRLRWLNYLKPKIKTGQFEEDEIDLITKLHKLLGNKWSLIAGRLPGRTTNSVKNFWNASLRRNVVSKPTLETKFPGMGKTPKTKAIRPQSQYLSKNFIFKNEKTWDGESGRQFGELNGPTNSSSSQAHQAPDPWGSEYCEMELWHRVLAEMEYNNGGSTSIIGPDSYWEQKWNGVSMGEIETVVYDSEDTWKHYISFNIDLWDIDNS